MVSLKNFKYAVRLFISLVIVIYHSCHVISYDHLFLFYFICIQPCMRISGHHLGVLLLLLFFLVALGT
jgi:hypothetical protein